MHHRRRRPLTRAPRVARRRRRRRLGPIRHKQQIILKHAHRGHLLAGGITPVVAAPCPAEAAGGAVDGGAGGVVLGGAGAGLCGAAGGGGEEFLHFGLGGGDELGGGGEPAGGVGFEGDLVVVAGGGFAVFDEHGEFEVVSFEGFEEADGAV